MKRKPTTLKRPPIGVIKDIEEKDGVINIKVEATPEVRNLLMMLRYLATGKRPH